MSSLDHRLHRLEEALHPRSKGHQVVMGMGGGGTPLRPDCFSEEEAKREAARLTQEGYEVTLILFGNQPPGSESSLAPADSHFPSARESLPTKIRHSP